MSTDYFKELERIQNIFTQGIGDLLRNHVNYVVRKYGGWNRYPRKIKKFLKRNELWKLKDSKLIPEGGICVHVAKDFKVMDNLVTMPNEFYQKLRNEILDFAPEVIFNES